METKDLPLDGDARAMADLAEVADWTALAGPIGDATGFEVVKALVQRVTAATGWKPWPDEPGTNYDTLRSWGFETPRGTTMIVSNDLVFADVRDSGWSAYNLTPDDIAHAEAGLDDHFPDAFELGVRTFGPPIWSSDYRNPVFEDEFWPGAGADKRHLTIWPRPGAVIFLYSDRPTASPLSESVGINYAVYLD